MGLSSQGFNKYPGKNTPQGVKGGKKIARNRKRIEQGTNSKRK